jgi:hypothetical protein
MCFRTSENSIFVWVISIYQKFEMHYQVTKGIVLSVGYPCVKLIKNACEQIINYTHIISYDHQYCYSCQEVVHKLNFKENITKVKWLRLINDNVGFLEERRKHTTSVKKRNSNIYLLTKDILITCRILHIYSSILNGYGGQPWINKLFSFSRLNRKKTIAWSNKSYIYLCKATVVFFLSKSSWMFLL